MTDAELDAIEARCKAASPGPWVEGVLNDIQAPNRNPGNNPHAHCNKVCGVAAGASIPQEVEGADAAFIAHARADVPALLAEVRFLTRVMEDASDDGKGAAELAAARRENERLAGLLAEARDELRMLRAAPPIPPPYATHHLELRNGSTRTLELDTRLSPYEEANAEYLRHALGDAARRLGTALAVGVERGKWYAVRLEERRREGAGGYPGRAGRDATLSARLTVTPLDGGTLALPEGGR